MENQEIDIDIKCIKNVVDELSVKNKKMFMIKYWDNIHNIYVFYYLVNTLIQSMFYEYFNKNIYFGERWNNYYENDIIINYYNLQIGIYNGYLCILFYLMKNALSPQYTYNTIFYKYSRLYMKINVVYWMYYFLIEALGIIVRLKMDKYNYINIFIYTFIIIKTWMVVIILENHNKSNKKD